MTIVSVASFEDESEVLDRTSLAKLAQLDPSGQSRLVERVLTTYQGSLARLRQQIVVGGVGADPSALRMGVHTLKSSSASIGALQLSQLCAEVEQTLREGRTEQLPGLVAQLQREADRVDAAVRRLMAV
ncbi:Hpt domain-containing protein [Ideonella sp. A 288]|uniref:Hpt domain-containing protein n=1 Tax=Ideonella sp. A 288 TaxID=1962181 RepID=UPI001F32867A|nr:Hpt domain-containing protein [Ideonella sp. A 288]